MSSPERMALMERNITRLALLVQQLDEIELANQERHARWELQMQESDQRMREIDQRMREIDQRMREIDQRMHTHAEEMRRLNEQSAAHAESIRAMLTIIVEMQTDIARIEAAS